MCSMARQRAIFGHYTLSLAVLSGVSGFTYMCTCTIPPSFTFSMVFDAPDLTPPIFFKKRLHIDNSCQ